MPHALERIVDILHDRRRFTSPAELKQLLPDVTSVAMNHGLWDAAKEFFDHHDSMFFRDGVERLLNDVASKRVHAEAESIPTDGVGDSDDLLWCTMLEAPLNKEVAESVDHQWIRLGDDCLDYLELLLDSTNLELLLKEDRSLLVIAMNDLVDDELPVAVHCLVKHATVIDRLIPIDVALQCLRGWLSESVAEGRRESKDIPSWQCLQQSH